MPPQLRGHRGSAWFAVSVSGQRSGARSASVQGFEGCLINYAPMHFAISGEAATGAMKTTTGEKKGEEEEEYA